MGDVFQFRHAGLSVVREVVSNPITIENDIANLALAFISEDGDLVRLIVLVILEGLVVKVLSFHLEADGQPMHDFLIFVCCRMAHPDTSHDVSNVFILESYDGLDAHAWLVRHQQLGQVGHEFRTLLLYTM